MTKKQLEGLFSFPSGIDQLYVPRQDAVESILYQFYELAGLQIPRVFYFKSPLALQMAINYLPKGKVKKERDPDFIRDYPAFASALLHDEISTRNKNRFFWEFVSKSIAAKGVEHLDGPDCVLHDFSRLNHLSSTIENAVEEDVQKRLALKGMEMEERARHPHFGDIAWLLAHRKFLNKLSTNDRNLFLLFYDLIRNGLMHAWLLEDAVLWCPLPTTFKINDLKQLHCEDGPALHWNDDYGLYFWKGIRVRKRIIELPESITRLDVLEESDFEIRKCIQQRMGARNYAALFNLVEMDRDSDLQGNEQFLWRTAHVDEFNHDYLYFAEVTSPKTNRRHFVEVPGGMSNVWEAVAWTLGNDDDNQQALIEV